jgi:hypothetical protein
MAAEAAEVLREWRRAERLFYLEAGRADAELGEPG